MLPLAGPKSYSKHLLGVLFLRTRRFVFIRALKTKGFWGIVAASCEATHRVYPISLQPHMHDGLEIALEWRTGQTRWVASRDLATTSLRLTPSLRSAKYGGQQFPRLRLVGSSSYSSSRRAHDTKRVMSKKDCRTQPTSKGPRWGHLFLQG